ncbi:MAG: pitrilysin family protein [Acidobacteriota bacterium]
MTSVLHPDGATDTGTPGNVVVRHVPGMPLMSARVWLRGGSRLEPTPGQSMITGRLLAEGTRRRDWSRLAADIEGRGMLLQSFGTADKLVLNLDALAEDWRLAVQWLAELLLEPSFPEPRFAWLCRQTAAELEGLTDQPDYRTLRGFMDRLYGDHPYGRPLQGGADSLGALSVDDCADLHRRVLSWGGSLVIAGDFDADAVRAEVGDRFAGLGTAVPPKVAAPEPMEPGRHGLQVGGGEQAHVFAGHLTLPRTHPDLPALQLAGVVLGAGAGMAGRLPERVREREGLAYSVDVSTVAGAGFDCGRLVIYVGTSPRTVPQAELAIREEVERLVEHGIDDDELEEARAYLVGRDPFRRETLRQRADLMAEAGLYGQPVHRPGWLVERWRSLDRRGVEAAVRRWIHPDRLQTVIGWPGTPAADSE